MFWPSAIVNDSNNRPYSLFTYEGKFKLEEAKQVINKWKNYKNIEVLCAYIRDENNDVVYIENNVDAFGNVHYKTNQEDIVKSDKGRQKVK